MTFIIMLTLAPAAGWFASERAESVLNASICVRILGTRTSDLRRCSARRWSDLAGRGKKKKV